MKPGVYSDISNEDYHSGPGISKSGLDLIHRSPLHYRHAYEPDNDNRPDTKAYFIGREIHSLVLEPELFYREYSLAFTHDQMPEAVEDREVLVKMVEEINAERVAAHPDAIRDTESLIDMISKMNETRLAKLSLTGNKKDLVLRIMDSMGEGDALSNPERFNELNKNSQADLKWSIDAMNADREGLLSISGTRQELSQRLRDNGVELTLWSEITDAYQAEHDRPYVLPTSSASRQDMAAWLNANGKEVKLWSDVKAQWDEVNKDRQILNQAQWDAVHMAANSIKNHPAASKLLSKGKAEQSIYWTDESTGELCRCRPDWWRDDGIVVDLKTTENASLDGFAKSIANFRYDVQAAFYLDGIEKATGKRPRGFVFVAIEKKPPFAVGVYVLKAETLGDATEVYKRDLAVYAACNQSGAWPGYGDEIQAIDMPAWHAKKNQKFIEG